jgi:hypothetical protein
MPQIPEDVLDAVFFLFPNKQSAEGGHKFGGTGFIIGIPSSASSTHTHLYAVTNRHVAIEQGNSVLRVNTRGGGSDTLEFDPSDWTPHPDGYDLAAMYLELDPDKHAIRCIPPSMLIGVTEHRATLGDNVFMVGRFVDHDGGVTNTASVRFGNVAVMPTPMDQGAGKHLESYCVDMHSRTGYSGSPVFVYRSIGDHLAEDLKARTTVIGRPGFLNLLGIHWSQFPEWLPVWNSKTDAAAKKPSVAQAKAMSGMTCVIPAIHIQELMNVEEFVADRAHRDSVIAAELKLGERPSPEVATSDDSDERFERTVKAMLDSPPFLHKPTAKRKRNPAKRRK